MLYTQTSVFSAILAARLDSAERRRAATTPAPPAKSSSYGSVASLHAYEYEKLSGNRAGPLVFLASAPWAGEGQGKRRGLGRGKRRGVGRDEASAVGMGKWASKTDTVSALGIFKTINLMTYHDVLFLCFI